MLIGLGKEPVAERVIVEWPTGRRQEVTSVAAGTLLTLYENPADAPDGSGQQRAPYIPEQRPMPAALAGSDSEQRLEWVAAQESEARPALRMFTTMATWCAACKSRIPQLQHIRQMFGSDALGMFGVPIDQADTAEMLESYASRYSPGYEVLAGLPVGQVDEVRRTLQTALQVDVLPATMVTDADGNVLATMAGVPTVSQLRKVLREVRGTQVALETH